MIPVTKPGKLRDGGVIFAVAPAGPVNEEKYRSGAAEIERRGFAVKSRPDLFSRENFLAGDDRRRAGELMEAFLDPGSDAVWCARGGYGSMRILELLDFGAIARSRKPLIGFSDITALELALLKHCGLVTFHGPLISTLAGEIEISRRHLFELLTGRATGAAVYAPEGVAVRAGTCRGTLMGGNLTLVCSLLGTGHLPSAEGAILFLEEVNEEPYRIDRMLTQLRLAGVLEGAAGVVLGRMSGEGDEAPLAALDGLACPVLRGFPTGHGALNMTLPQGIKAELDSEGRRITLLEPCVE
jgi:muramoyltetrapeptide carboxypeptidase